MPARLLRAMPPGSKVIVYGSLDNKVSFFYSLRITTR